jgi:hypothetical protein
LLYGTAHPALAADDDLEMVVGRLRQAWPDVEIHFRGDSGFGVPPMYDVCERLGVDYTIGLAMNTRLKKLSENTLKTAVERFEATGVSVHGAAEAAAEPRRTMGKQWARDCRQGSDGNKEGGGAPQR